MIRITRTVLSEELRGRLAALAKEVNAAEPGTRVVTAREIWKRSSTRAHVHGPLGRTLRDMALGLEQCMEAYAKPRKFTDYRVIR
jgi:Asp-tRNA(Asn)/Glu-tRNA(Gln) amidotransferase A subunit family amidase